MSLLPQSHSYRLTTVSQPTHYSNCPAYNSSDPIEQKTPFPLLYSISTVETRLFAKADVYLFLGRCPATEPDKAKSLRYCPCLRTFYWKIRICILDVVIFSDEACFHGRRNIRIWSSEHTRVIHKKALTAIKDRFMMRSVSSKYGGVTFLQGCS
jgi:hypothetical protein